MAISAGDGVDLILDSGLVVEVKSYSDAEIAGRHASIRVRQAPPSPSSVIAEQSDEAVVYVVPRLTKGLADLAMADSRIGVVSTGDGVVIWDRKRYESGTRPAVSETTRGRVPWARYALVRVLARTSRPRTQQQLAYEAGVTQASVSQNLQRLAGDARQSSSGWAASDPRRLADLFLSEYPGAKGITLYWYGIDSIANQTRKLSGLDHDILLSGDAGADIIAPWRVPRRAVVYAKSGLDLASVGFAETDREKATLELTIPADPTVWPVASMFDRGHPHRSVVDPLLCAYDIRRSGGTDSDQAVERLVEHVAMTWARGDD